MEHSLLHYNSERNEIKRRFLNRHKGFEFMILNQHLKDMPLNANSLWLYFLCLLIAAYPNPHPNPENPSPICRTVSHAHKRALSAEVQDEFGLGGRFLGSMLKLVIVWDKRARPLTIKLHFTQVSSTVPQTYLHDKRERGSVDPSHGRGHWVLHL